ncbi:MAG: rhodanese-like domain-containing protein [Candidatus Buchananbacteria bacterium]|nr:rhodanese-like domain-containing protein [Candidatus Buchananbacteria bacterium]
MQPEISSHEVHSRLKNQQPCTLLDVRTKEEFDRAHIQGALFLPLDEISQLSLTKLGLEKNQEIIVYCLSGPRGFDAAKILANLGYTNVKNMTSGLLAWRANGYSFLVSGQ